MIDEENEWTDPRTELERALDFYSDIHKDAYGFRPRVEWKGTLEDLYAEIDDLAATVREQETLRVEQEKQCWQEFLDRIENYLIEFKIDRATAILWIFQAEGVELADIDQFCYETGLAFSREATIKEMLNV